jgi:hypothetical protein
VLGLIGEVVHWSQRPRQHPLITGRVANLLERQHGRCAWCGTPFVDRAAMEVDHVRAHVRTCSRVVPARGRLRSTHEWYVGTGPTLRGTRRQPPPCVQRHGDQKRPDFDEAEAGDGACLRCSCRQRWVAADPPDHTALRVSLKPQAVYARLACWRGLRRCPVRATTPRFPARWGRCETRPPPRVRCR